MLYHHTRSGICERSTGQSEAPCASAVLLCAGPVPLERVAAYAVAVPCMRAQHRRESVAPYTSSVLDSA
eukprot:699886-Rhodomonas_salina.1